MVGHGIASILNGSVAYIYGSYLFFILTFAPWILLLPVEYLWPIRPLSLKDRRFHLIYALTTGPITNQLLRPILFVIFGISLFNYSQPRAEIKHLIVIPFAKSLPVLNLGSLFNSLPLPALSFTVIAMLVGDFFFYWIHRAVHTIPILWPIHKLHHTDENLNSLSYQLAHFLDAPLTMVAFGVPLGWLKFCAGGNMPNSSGNIIEEIFLYCILVSLQFSVPHANWRLRLGPLTRVVIGPQTHRIHHSLSPQHVNKNFASFFPIWDILFGTYHHPRRDEWPETGLRDEKQPPTQLEAFLVPFRAWNKLFAEPPDQGKIEEKKSA